MIESFIKIYKNRLLNTLVIVLSFIAIFSCQKTYAQTGSYFQFNPSSGSYSAGNFFTVQVQGNSGGSDVTGFEARVLLPKASFTQPTITHGSLGTGWTWNADYNSSDTTNWIMDVSAYRTSGTPITASTTLFSYGTSLTASGTASFSRNFTYMSNPDGSSFFPTISTGSYTVQAAPTASPTPAGGRCLPEGNIDCLNGVNWTDVTLLLSSYGKTYTTNPVSDTAAYAADLDGSLKVTIIDLFMLLANYGKTSTP